MEKIIESKLGEIIVRPFGLQDIDYQMDYLYNNSKEFLEGIGFDVAKLPGRKKHTEMMRERINLSLSDQQSFAMVAEHNQKSIAVVVLAPDEGGKGAHAHFHIWNESLRGRGLGIFIFKTGLKMLMNHQNRNEVLIEPHESNKRMNRLMEKCGFEFIEKCVFSNPLTLDFPANRYKILLKNLELL